MNLSNHAINWKWKVPVFWLTSYVPGGRTLRYLLQRHLTRSLPASEESFAKEVAIAEKHGNVLVNYGCSPKLEPKVAEIGTGWDLIVPLYLSLCKGFKHQVTVDISPLLRPELVRDAARRFGAEEENADTGIQRLIVKRFGEGLSSGEFDGVISTNTFEHIYPDEIPKVLSECYRVLKPRGVLSLRIDYVDHYSYFDRRVSPYNFLHYSDAAWKIFNPPDHYQNRLRHSDYVGMLEKAGFVVVEQATTPITSTELAWLRSVPLHKRFRGYAEDDLAVLGSFIVARPSRCSSRDRQH